MTAGRKNRPGGNSGRGEGRKGGSRGGTAGEADRPRDGRQRLSAADEEAARLTQEVTARAIRRLDLLEWAIFLGIAVLAVVGGALAALLLTQAVDVDFRRSWMVISLVLFVVPGTMALVTLRREERLRADRLAQLRDERDR